MTKIVKEGGITIRQTGNHKYQYIKINGVFECLHKVNYEKKHGKITKKGKLFFKDGDRLNANVGFKSATKPKKPKKEKKKIIKPVEFDDLIKFIKDEKFDVILGFDWI